MADWVIPCNTASYDIVSAFKTLKKLDWKQSIKIEKGSLVYIYVGAPISAIKYKCKAIEVDKPESIIDDSEFVIDDEEYKNYGRYMCLQLIEEYPDDMYPRKIIMDNGLKTIQGPSKVTETLQKFISQCLIIKKYTKNQAVWIATALMAYEKYENNPYVKKQDMYFKNEDIVKRAQSLIKDGYKNKDCPQIVSVTCCADSNEPTHYYLRGDNESDKNLRRLSCLNEFKIDTMPSNLNEEDSLIMNGRLISMKELIAFVKEQYPSVVMPPANVEKEYWPLLSEYNPGIDAETYENLLNTVCVHDHLDVLYYMYRMGGEATCKQIAAKFGNTYNHYLTNANNIAKNIARETSCSLCKRADGSSQYWPVLFFGKDINDPAEGVFKWKLREPLKEAIKRLEEGGVFEDMQSAVDFDYNMILYGPPGTGKTYYTVIYAVAIADNRPFDIVESEAKADYQKVLDRYNELKKEGRIAFTTFHQSYGYEEFIEGIKPVVDDSSGEIGYTIEDGVFKAFCKRAEIPVSYNIDHMANVWKIILKQPGDSDLKKECFENGTIRFDWKSQDECVGKIDYSYVCLFRDKLKIGDIVVSYFGSSTDIDGVGIVTGDAEYDESKISFRWSRTVKWVYYGKPVNIKALNDNIYLANDKIHSLKRVKISELFKLIKPQEYQANDKNYVFIIDEINRGNISKIFGELITLIEETKRKGSDEEMSAILPYSSETFSVPNNVYILGTMNTADRSIALLDTALRRRFRFVEMLPNPQVLKDIGVDVVTYKGQSLDVAKMLEIINRRIECLYDREHTIGHAFFTKLKYDSTVEQLGRIFQRAVVPLLQEYFYDDYEKIQLVLGDNNKDEELKFIRDLPIDTHIFNEYNSEIAGLPETIYEIQTSAFTNFQSYKKIHESL